MPSYAKSPWIVVTLLAVAPHVQGAGQKEVVESYTRSTVAASDVALFLERRRCFGFCPSYRVTIFGTGRIEYEGLANVKTTGVQRSQIPEQDVLELVNQFMRSNFFDAADQYLMSDTMYVQAGRWGFASVSIPDAPEFRLGLKIGSYEKRVLAKTGHPKALEDLSEEIDRAANVTKWIGTLCERQGSAALPQCRE